MKALKFDVEHNDVKAINLRPIWVWKRKGGNAMTKMGYKRKNKGGGAGDEADGEEGEGEEQQEAEAEEEMKMGDSIEGSWGKSRGREGRNMIEKKANRMSMDASGGAAADDGSGGLGHPSNVPWDFAVGDRVEGRSVEEGYEGLRAMAGILEIDQVNRRANATV